MSLPPHPSQPPAMPPEPDRVETFPVATEDVKTPVGSYTILEIQNQFFARRWPAHSQVFAGGSWVPIERFLQENRHLLYASAEKKHDLENRLEPEEKARIRRKGLLRILLGIAGLLGGGGIIFATRHSESGSILVPAGLLILGASQLMIGIYQLLQPRKSHLKDPLEL